MCVRRDAYGAYDGWALSTSAEALRDVWALCPPETRLCVWVKGTRNAKSRTALNAQRRGIRWCRWGGYDVNGVQAAGNEDPGFLCQSCPTRRL